MCQTTKGVISCLPQKFYYKPDDARTMLRCKTECSISASHLYIYIWTYRVSVTSRVQHNHCPCLDVPSKKCVGCSHHLGSKPTKLTISFIKISAEIVYCANQEEAKIKVICMQINSLVYNIVVIRS